VLTNFGSLGDLQPFLALDTEMRRHGHAPLLAFSLYFRSRVEALRLDFVPIGPDLQAIQNNANVTMRTQPDSDDRVEEILSPLIAALSQAFSELSHVCSEADILISGAAQPAARMAHETSGIPFVSVRFSHFGGIGSPLPRNSSAALINSFRAQLGLVPLRDPLTIDANSSQLVLYAMSRYVGSPQLNWPSHYHITRYLFLDDEQWDPRRKIVDFIEAQPIRL
jgi:sterol 3beta-glucosyltransferase